MNMRNVIKHANREILHGNDIGALKHFIQVLLYCTVNTYLVKSLHGVCMADRSMSHRQMNVGIRTNTQTSI